MENNTNIVLVPTDFTNVAECAINHACMLAKQNKNEVTLLHILTKNNKAEDSLVNQLQSQCDYFSGKYGIKVNKLFKEGSIFTTIGEVADELKASLVVMGTHGVVGMQKLTGAWAIKVIESSNVPVIVVKSKMPQLEGYKKIVLPVDFSVETKQKTMQTLNMAKMFDATVYLYKQKGIDDIHQSKIDLNAQFIKRYLKEQDIPHVEEQQAKASVDFDKDFIQYAKEVEANLIIILTTKEKELIEFVLGPVEQKVINNKEEIPVMCIHPLQNLYKTERLASMINLSF